ncbi:MAG: hypothetical protein JSS96_09525 [Bacteroidetes bacterium]|nr:hypothetical protein [Bacteroidota bacterium]
MKRVLWLRSVVLAALLMCSPMLAVKSHAGILDDLFGWLGGGGSGGGSCPPATAPIDGGLSLLVVAGVGYGIKKMAAGKKDITDAKDK